eukprot:11479285-Alexandrium_andersonii.AAC.1
MGFALRGARWSSPAFRRVAGSRLPFAVLDAAQLFARPCRPRVLPTPWQSPGVPPRGGYFRVSHVQCDS